MKQINTLPIEDFLEKARIAIKSNQKTISFTLKEVTDLQNSLSIVMTRLAGETSVVQQPEVIQVKMDGGRF
jgi:hypothetical protein